MAGPLPRAVDPPAYLTPHSDAESLKSEAPDYDFQAHNIELKPVTVEAFEAAWWNQGTPKPEHREPLVPFAKVPWTDFQATEPYDVICLSQSPPFTPAESDVLFNEIRTQFIDETAFA